MRRLILFRHAKSCWADPDLADHDRPLTQRGQLAAPLMGAWLAWRGYLPDAVLCSSSARTIETWRAAQPMLPQSPPPQILRDLYHADPETLLRLLRAAPDSAGTVAIVGHQPGIGAFARKLASIDTPPGCARAFQKFPTAACAVMDFDVDRWSDVAFGAARFHAFAIPRELV
ncbi:MAG: histidine phosphatase family protein [Rubrimonas sp.]|uniref:SixA phosphatase family protein n=1 Tax=Rubrimonas sp. TaxID=2036015 RepID=UPI002FDD176D